MIVHDEAIIHRIETLTELQGEIGRELFPDNIQARGVDRFDEHVLFTGEGVITEDLRMRVFGHRVINLNPEGAETTAQLFVRYTGERTGDTGFGWFSSNEFTPSLQMHDIAELAFTLDANTFDHIARLILRATSEEE